MGYPMVDGDGDVKPLSDQLVKYVVSPYRSKWIVERDTPHDKPRPVVAWHDTQEDALDWVENHHGHAIILDRRMMIGDSIN